MKAGKSVLFVSISSLLLGGCVGVRTGNAAVDTAVYGTLAAAEAKEEKQQQAQRDFESELAKLNPKSK